MRKWPKMRPQIDYCSRRVDDLTTNSSDAYLDRFNEFNDVKYTKYLIEITGEMDHKGRLQPISFLTRQVWEYIRPPSVWIPSGKSPPVSIMYTNRSSNTEQNHQFAGWFVEFSVRKVIAGFCVVMFFRNYLKTTSAFIILMRIVDEYLPLIIFRGSIWIRSYKIELAPPSVGRIFLNRWNSQSSDRLRPIRAGWRQFIRFY